MSGHERRAFLEAILANPDDDTPRLVYADWLEENGDAVRAEFIRVQVERTRLPQWDARQVPLKLREERLLAMHAHKWRAELPRIKDVVWDEFRRGFMATARFKYFDAIRKTASACRAATPLEAIVVRWPRRREVPESLDPIPGLRELTIPSKLVDPREVDRLADAPMLATLRTLNLGKTSLGVDGFRRLLTSPHLGTLVALRAPYNSIGNEGVTILADAVHLQSLEELDLSETGYYGRYGEDPTVDSNGLEVLASWRSLARLRSLKLSGNDVGRDGLRALLQSPRAAGLKELALRGNPVDGWVMEEFGGATKNMQLDVLDIGENLLRDYGAERLASAPCLSELKVLSLDRCEMPPRAGHLLARAPFLGSLRKLNLNNNGLGPEGLRALLAKNPRELHTLGMVDNDIGNEGGCDLAESPASNTLLELDLSQNSLGEPSAQALAESKHLQKLLVLRMFGNRFTGRVLDALTNSPLGKRLVLLEARPIADEDDIPF